MIAVIPAEAGIQRFGSGYAGSGQVGVDAELPGVPEGADRLGLTGQVLVPAVGHVLPVDEGLEVGAVAGVMVWARPSRANGNR